MSVYNINPMAPAIAPATAAVFPTAGPSLLLELAGVDDVGPAEVVALVEAAIPFPDALVEACPLAVLVPIVEDTLEPALVLEF
jgi:hypothetical protein